MLLSLKGTISCRSYFLKMIFFIFEIIIRSCKIMNLTIRRSKESENQCMILLIQNTDKYDKDVKFSLRNDTLKFNKHNTMLPLHILCQRKQRED